jgi:hypothetical protein
MAYVILAALILSGVCWGFYKSGSRGAARNSGRPQRQFRYGYVRRFSPLGRSPIQSDEQRSEVMRANRDRYDPSIDRLDPRNKDYRDSIE